MQEISNADARMHSFNQFLATVNLIVEHFSRECGVLEEYQSKAMQELAPKAVKAFDLRLGELVDFSRVTGTMPLEWAWELGRAIVQEAWPVEYDLLTNKPEVSA